MRIAAPLLALALLATMPGNSADGRPPRAGSPNRPPFPCFTQVWNGDFEVAGPQYSAADRRLVWQLKARKQVQPPRYDSLGTNVDGIEQVVAQVRFTPAQEEYEEGAVIQAVVQLPDDRDIDDLSKLVIRARRR